MTGFSMPTRWRGRTPADDANCIVAHCGDCGGLLAVCPDPGPEDFAHFESLSKAGEVVTRRRFDSLSPPYCTCVADGGEILSSLYRVALGAVAGMVLGIILWPWARAYGLPAALGLSFACSALGLYVGAKWGGVGMAVRVERAGKND